MKKPTPAAVLLAALFTASALFAYEAGGFAYTKRIETKLLAEPKPLAEATGQLPFGKQVKVEEVKGAWLRVSDGPVGGWVFAGNLADTKPAEVKGLLDGAPIAASKTTATAAARPLDEAAVKYASGQQNLASAQEDLEWMITACAAVTHEDVETYLQTKKKGEYQ
ncbi:MAG TPA: SH3 domain-containing protein [Lacunisphaera sp.]